MSEKTTKKIKTEYLNYEKWLEAKKGLISNNNYTPNNIIRFFDNNYQYFQFDSDAFFIFPRFQLLKDGNKTLTKILQGIHNNLLNGQDLPKKMTKSYGEGIWYCSEEFEKVFTAFLTSDKRDRALSSEDYYRFRQRRIHRYFLRKKMQKNKSDFYQKMVVSLICEATKLLNDVNINPPQNNHKNTVIFWGFARSWFTSLNNLPDLKQLIEENPVLYIFFIVKVAEFLEKVFLSKSFWYGDDTTKRQYEAVENALEFITKVYALPLPEEKYYCTTDHQGSLHLTYALFQEQGLPLKKKVRTYHSFVKPGYDRKNLKEFSDKLYWDYGGADHCSDYFGKYLKVIGLFDKEISSLITRCGYKF